MDTLEQLTEILTSAYSIPRSKIRQHTKLSELELPNLELIELLLTCEDQFGVTLPTEKMIDEDWTLEGIWSSIENKVKAKP